MFFDDEPTGTDGGAAAPTPADEEETGETNESM